MAYDYNDKLAPEVTALADKYSADAQAGYGQDMAGLRQDATRELDAEIFGKDLQGRQAGYLRAATDQGMNDEQNRWESGLALRRAKYGEDTRQRLEQRSWDVRDRDERLYQLRKKAEAERKMKEDEARGGLMGDIGTGTGTIVGGVIGGVLGAEEGGIGAVPGATLGAGVGGAAGGSIGSAL